MSDKKPFEDRVHGFRAAAEQANAPKPRPPTKEEIINQRGRAREEAKRPFAKAFIDVAYEFEQELKQNGFEESGVHIVLQGNAEDKDNIWLEYWYKTRNPVYRIYPDGGFGRGEFKIERYEFGRAMVSSGGDYSNPGGPYREKKASWHIKSGDHRFPSSVSSREELHEALLNIAAKDIARGTPEPISRDLKPDRDPNAVGPVKIAIGGLALLLLAKCNGAFGEELPDPKPSLERHSYEASTLDR